jgi:hypothetical protein
MLLCCACFAALIAFPASAAAEIEIESFSFAPSTSLAGAHPDLETTFSFKDPGEPETAAAAELDLPPGFWLYFDEAPRCTPTQLGNSECPIDAQVGIVNVHGSYLGSPGSFLGSAPVYSMPTQDGEFGHLAFVVPTTVDPVEVPVWIDPNFFNLSLLFEEFPAEVEIEEVEFELWGIPSSSAHDEERFPLVPGGRQSGQPQRPFTRNPTACSTPTATLSARSYEDPEAVSTAIANAPPVTGCEKIVSSPTLSFTAGSTEAATASGLDLELVNPQDLTANGRSTSDLAFLAVELEGYSVNEASVGSRLGSFSTALVGTEEPLEGRVYFDGAVGAGSYRLSLIASGPNLELELPAWLEADGRAAVLEVELPQVPLEAFHVQLDSAGSILSTPDQCGSFKALGETVPWSQPLSQFLVESAFTISSGPGGGPCPEPQATTTAGAGAAASSPPAPTPRNPMITLRKHPPHRGHDRTPAFSFVSSVPSSSFRCKVDRRPWRPCHSPLTLRKLAFGRHAFRVKAIAPAGAQSPPLTYRFVLTRA